MNADANCRLPRIARVPYWYIITKIIFLFCDDLFIESLCDILSLPAFSLTWSWSSKQITFRQGLAFPHLEYWNEATDLDLTGPEFCQVIRADSQDPGSGANQLMQICCLLSMENLSAYCLATTTTATGTALARLSIL